MVAREALVRRACEAWRESPPVPRASTAAISFGLQPSRALARAAWSWLLLSAAYGFELLLRGHPVVAMAVLAMTAGIHHGMFRRAREHRDLPRRLLLARDGRLFLLTVGGEVEGLRLQGPSMHLGPWLLLQVRGRSVHRWVLGPDNVPPAQLAALRRRLLRPDAAVEAARCGSARLPLPAAPAAGRRRPSSA